MPDRPPKKRLYVSSPDAIRALIHRLDQPVLGPYCGNRCCEGRCGIPAAYIEEKGRRFYLRGSMTAVGPLMQDLGKSLHPDGPAVDLRELLSEEDAAALLKGYWW